MKRTRFLVFALLLGTAWAAPRCTLAATPQSPAESYEGFSLELLAEHWVRHGDFKTRFGDKQGPVEFEKYLLAKGLSSQRFWRAYQAWWTRFKADPTGRLEAEFNTKVAEWSQKLNFGDVPDMSRMTREGVTLDGYARCVAGLSRPGARPEEVIRANGLRDMAHWERVNKAWGEAMAQDTSFRLAQQYAQLFQKHAGASFQKEQQQKLAEVLAEGNRPHDVVRAEEDTPNMSPEALYSRLSSRSRDERWKAARWLGLKCDADSVKRKDTAMMTKCQAAVPVLIDILEHHDDDTVGRAEDAARQLMNMVGGRTEESHFAMRVCLNRAQARLDTLRMAFAPIQNKAVPERVTLQTRIQEYQSLANALDRHLKAWKKK